MKFLNRAYLNEIFKYDPCKCNFLSSFSGCVHQDIRKCCIALPIDSETVKLFERTLIGGFSDVKLKLAFDSQVLLPKHQRDEMKLIYKIKTGDGTSQNKRISTKILKLDENNQYGNTMTKPLPFGCIKK